MLDALDVFDFGICVKECPKEETDTIECIPTSKVTACQPRTSEEYATYDFLSYCVPKTSTLPEDVQDTWEEVGDSLLGGSLGTMLADVMTAKWVLVISIIVCILVTFLYIFLMHYCAFWLSWISVGLIQVSLVLIGWFAFDYRRD